MIVIIPFEKKPELSNPPVLTLLLIIINVICYFGWQSNDNALYEEAFDLYERTELYDVEIPRYIAWRKSKGSSDELPEYDKRNEQTIPVIIRAMFTDGEFQELLNNNKIIKSDESNFSEWRNDRDKFNSIIDKIVIEQYSLKTREPSALTMFTHMFLHADAGHLIGNMVFLFLFGFVVEISMGRLVFTGAYLLAGLASGLFYMVIEPNQIIPAIGASGAVFGLSGMYTMLYGFKKIRFFYTILFVYFDFVRAPAYLLLVAWLGLELYSQFFAESNINNLAHIGGLLAGAIIALIYKKFTSRVDYDYLEKERREEAFGDTMKTALDYIGKMQFSRAKPILRDALNKQPGNFEVLQQLYNIAKFEKNTIELNSHAQKLFSKENIQRQPASLIQTLFKDYLSSSGGAIKLSMDQMLELANFFSRNSLFEDAHRIISRLLKSAPKEPGVINSISVLASSLLNRGEVGKAKAVGKVLIERYPDSKETALFRKELAQKS